MVKELMWSKMYNISLDCLPKVNISFLKYFNIFQPIEQASFRMVFDWGKFYMNKMLIFKGILVNIHNLKK